MSKDCSGLVLLSILFYPSSGLMSTCKEDICANGYCNLDEDQAVCSCILGWTGDKCDIESSQYAEVECFNGYVLPLEDDLTCVCFSGYWGDTCDKVIADYHPCLDVDCNGHGYCYLDVDSNPWCTCDNGFSGDQCQHENSACGREYLLNVASSIYDTSWNSGLDCAYLLGLLYTSGTTNTVSGYPGGCTCLNALIWNKYWSENFGCVIDESYPVSLKDIDHIRCNHCTLDKISGMKDAIKNYSIECDAFITYRTQMPLYWRTPMKCVCLNSLGTREEVADWVYCPFSLHYSRTDLTSFDNCNDKYVSICDFKYVKDQLEFNLKTRNPAGLEQCITAMVLLFEMTPGTLINDLFDDWCPCYESIVEYWSDGLAVLDCKAVSFYRYTIKNLFLLSCNDVTFLDVEEVGAVAKVTTIASAQNYATAATCQNFVIYSSQLSMNATDGSLQRAKTLYCDCLEGLDQVAMSQNYTVQNNDIDWDVFKPEDFADGLLATIDMLSIFPNQMANESVDNCGFMIENLENSIYSVEGEEVITADYQIVNICLGLICAVLTMGNVYMYFSYQDVMNNFKHQ